MGYSLLLAARILAGVRAGTSLADVMGRLAEETPAARAAAQDLVYGVLRRSGWGEFVLGRLLARPLTHPETEALLLAALYRLETRFESAPMIVDQAVRAAAELVAGLKGVVNGVLRNYLRQRADLQAAAAADELAAHWHPRWWLNRLRRAYPESWPGIVEADNGLPPMTLRVNACRQSIAEYVRILNDNGIEAKPLGRDGLLLARPLPVDMLPGFREGWVSVQDAGAQRAAELLAPAPGARVLDACAAPGGKAAHLLERGTPELIALDVDATRARRIEENLQRLSLQAKVKVGDSRQPATWWDGRLFDAILADVPCSGSGVVRRHPDIKVLRRESDIRKFAKTQAEILDALWPLLMPGGKLLYATCSVFVEENGAQIDSFMVRHPGVVRLSDEQWLPAAEHDGFYYALLQKMA